MVVMYPFHHISEAGVYEIQRQNHPRRSNNADIASTFHSHETRQGLNMANVVAQAEVSGETWEESHANHSSLSGLGMSRTKSLFSMVSCSNVLLLSASDCNSSTDSSSCSEEDRGSASGTPLPSRVEADFAHSLRPIIGDSSQVLNFQSSEVRKTLEPYLRQTRRQREHSRSTSHHNCASPIASSMGVPYTSLRQERPFLFDEHTFPLHSILADTIKVHDLRQVHAIDDALLLTPLLNPETRHAFHAAYDGFVTSFCIPLLHSMAISMRILQHSAFEKIFYRYQAFPTIQISRPGEAAITSPTCDSIEGFSVGCLTFHVPLTPTEGTNAMYIESHPGKEDWHPLLAKSVGLGYLVDGARCIHFDLENTSSYSRVSLMFRILIHREQSQDTSLCSKKMLRDKFMGGTFYDEAVIDPRRTHAVAKAFHDGLLEPDARVGPPFAVCNC